MMFSSIFARSPVDDQVRSSRGDDLRESPGVVRRPRPLGRLAASLVTAVTLLAASATLSPPSSAASTPPTNDPTRAPYDLAVDAPVLIVLGQSNAVGWTATMKNPADLAQCASFSHVKGLNRQGNLTVGATQATWSPYTCTGSNLGAEWNSGRTYNVASVTAMRWERAINAGAALPDLNVIHVGWGNQGMQGTDGGNNRWWPDRDPTQIDSLHQLTLNTIGNGLRALQEAGKRPRVIGMHWNQWETDAALNTTVSTGHIQQAFLNVLEPLRTMTGATQAPVFLYRPRATLFQQAPTQHVLDALTGLANRPAPNPYTLIDPADATSATGTPLYQPSAAPTYGIFSGDAVHYTRAVHEWFADRQWKTVFTDGQYGAPVEDTANAALGRPATQSSTYAPSWPASRAVDGNTDGTWAGGSVTHTLSDYQAWWQTDLGAQRPIRDVEVFNRTDCCGDHLTDFYLLVSVTDLTGRSWASIEADPAVKRIRIKGTAPQKLTVPVGANGRFIRVQLAGTNELQLAEVRVNIPVPVPTVSSSYGTDQGQLGNLADGVPATYWVPNSGVTVNGTITVDYSTARTISAVTLATQYGQGAGITNLDVQTWDPARGIWVPQVAGAALTWNTNTSAIENRTIALPAPVTTTRIRLVPRTANHRWGHFVLNEIIAG
ncbi:discoidin domain-containing protein [Streptomyces sp. BE20]|uniref:discoidin domain-containing protein n=1 Tax=Streptomyces sp. BE20 TaxID=3002525 RepID=UPI002E77684D|nr:discoidin domain-containing protein [Streptomyces sp. BE20]MEE1825219.1 discoidin domain-containing protein [Streptomyces sp. BE20]